MRAHDVFRLVTVSLVALALAAPATPAGAVPPGGSPGKKKDDDKGKAPVPENGSYQRVKVAGYYSGSGTANVSDAEVQITASLNDPAGKSYTLSTNKLYRRENHFFGDGTLGGEQVDIDGRVDPVDTDDGVKLPPGQSRKVVKVGRILFNFRVRATGHGGRGVGEKTGKAAPPGNSGGGKGGNNGNGNGNRNVRPR